MNHDQSHGMGKHMLLMLICCLVPIGLVLAVGTFGLSLGPLQGLVPYVAALMCPLMMIVMMRGMLMGSHGDHHHHVEAPTLKSQTSNEVLSWAKDPQPQIPGVPGPEIVKNQITK